MQKNVNATIIAKIDYDDGLHKDKNDECVEEEGGTYLSLTVEKSIKEINR